MAPGVSPAALPRTFACTDARALRRDVASTGAASIARSASGRDGDMWGDPSGAAGRFGPRCVRRLLWAGTLHVVTIDGYAYMLGSLGG